MNAENTLQFSSHDLSIQVYSARDVYVEYAGSPHNISKGSLARAKTVQDDTRFINFKSGVYPTFAGPVEVKWTAADGSQLSATLNLDEIFRGRRVLHQDDQSRLYQNEPTYGPPIIIVEINDHTLNVYMFVTLRIEKGANIEHHDWRTLAFSQTF